MRCVQEALKDVIESGVPVQAGIWRTDNEDQNPPKQYIVYSTTVTEEAHCDDRPCLYKTVLYMDLWSKIDPTPLKLRVRNAMYDAGWFVQSESDKGYNQPAYDHYTHQYAVYWQFVRIDEEAQ